MLKEKESLAKAITAVIQLLLDSGKFHTQKEIAEKLGMKPPSLSESKKRGTISKQRLYALMELARSVAGPAHWGIESDSVMAQALDIEHDAGQRATPLLALETPPKLDFRYARAAKMADTRARQLDALVETVNAMSDTGMAELLNYAAYLLKKYPKPTEKKG